MNKLETTLTLRHLIALLRDYDKNNQYPESQYEGYAILRHILSESSLAELPYEDITDIDAEYKKIINILEAEGQ